MDPSEIDEVAGVAAPTTSESENPVDQNEVEDPTNTVANPPAEGKENDLAETSVAADDDHEASDVAATPSSNPVPDASGKPALANPSGGEQPPKNKRGRPPGSKNKSGVKKPATKKVVETATKQRPLETGIAPVLIKTGLPVLVDTSSLILRSPFSDLLPVDARTRQSIKSNMEVNGYDQSHPVHIFRDGNQSVVADGCTRTLLALELGIPAIPAFTHEFPDEKAALEFAIDCQIKRRNLSDGDLARFVELYDEKITPGSDQPRAGGGTFQPKASGDAHGKSAARTAAKLGVSPSKVERARRVNKQADPATKKAVQENKLSVNAALKQMKPAGTKANLSEQPKPSTPPNGKANAHPLSDEAKDFQELHFKAIEAADSAETFLRNAQGKTLTAPQRHDWKTVIGQIVGLLGALGVTVG